MSLRIDSRENTEHDDGLNYLELTVIIDNYDIGDVSDQYGSGRFLEGIVFGEAIVCIPIRVGDNNSSFYDLEKMDVWYNDLDIQLVDQDGGDYGPKSYDDTGWLDKTIKKFIELELNSNQERKTNV